jgi:hypothetical protein
MTQQVKNAVSNWIEDFDNAYDYTKLTTEQKKERMLNIKAMINLCNDFEKNSLWNKFKTIYPMQFPNAHEKTLFPKAISIPVNFNKKYDELKNLINKQEDE